VFKHLLPTYPSINKIVSHDYNMKTFSGLPPKGCPGTGFDWTLLEKKLTSNNKKFTKIETGSYQLA